MGFFGKGGGLLREAAALRHIKASVMIADPDLNIVYVNDAAMALMREAEAVLKAELPRFSVATLVGSNIDIFHKNPLHQRQMLAALDRVHDATIKVGTRTFDLTITPLTEAGARHGFAVEWFDARVRLQNMDYTGKIKAIDNGQATIDLTPDGTILDANDNFLHLTGYSRAELVGCHHRMFLTQEEQSTPEYAAHWAGLAAGQAVSGEFKRLTKTGQTVWIEGSYNPISGPDGRIVKIMKIVSDVTKKVQLLADLKRMIDDNFAEIDSALTQSVGEADCASAAAGETLTTVQTVAAGTEQLASSIREISSSMARSQAATDEAFNQAVAVGENTGKLSQAAREMNGIVDLIRKIAGQINLLALNATIEAARAGEAGRGFAVVASEVKDLANQSARATQRISKEITAIQATAGDVAGALDHIRQSMTNLREYVTSTASAVEEQNAVTSSISRDMQSAAETVATTSMSINGMSAAVSQVAQAVAKTKQAAAVLVR